MGRPEWPSFTRTTLQESGGGKGSRRLSTTSLGLFGNTKGAFHFFFFFFFL